MHTTRVLHHELRGSTPAEPPDATANATADATADVMADATADVMADGHGGAGEGTGLEAPIDEAREEEAAEPRGRVQHLRQ